MATPDVLLLPGKTAYWDTDQYEVTVAKCPVPPAFYHTAYLVKVNGKPVGFVVSRKERGHATLWGHTTSLSVSNGAGMPSRAMAVEALMYRLAQRGDL